MERDAVKKNNRIIAINVIAIILFIVCEFLSYTILSNPEYLRLLCRVISRGIFGLWCIYNALYLLFTSKWSFLCLNSTPKQRLICGVILGLLGLLGLITALLGYGTNGDPRLIWWESLSR